MKKAGNKDHQEKKKPRVTAKRRSLRPAKERKPKPLPVELAGKSDREILKTLATQVFAKDKLHTEFGTDIKLELTSLLSAHKEDKLSSHPQLYRDLTDLHWVSIDNDDTMDIDQVTAAEQLEDGRVRILIGVADCDYFIRKGGPMDQYASHNTVSIYTPAKVFTMLPTELSYDLASLVQGEDRKSFVIDITFSNDSDAHILEEHVYLATLQNKAKLAYPSVSKWLKGETDMPPALQAVKDADKIAETIKLQDKIAKAILRKRRNEGALEFENHQPILVWEGDEISNVIVERQNRAQKLIENFMLTANAVCSRFLLANKFPSLQRVVKEPERWEEIVEFASSYTYTLPGEPNNKALRAFLVERRQADPELFPDLSLTVIKLMGRGEYVFSPPGAISVGHFGLGIVDYTHSTAPNRRFPDLITQRLVVNVLLDQPPQYTVEELALLAKRCTEVEAIVSKGERQLNKSAVALLLQDRIGEKFEGIVTGASAKGYFVRLFDIPVEGRLVKNVHGLKVGDRTKVELVAVDIAKGFIDFQQFLKVKTQK